MIIQSKMLYKILSLFYVAYLVASDECWSNRVEWSSKNGFITVNGIPFFLKGISWFGFETDTHAPHGLWSHSMASILNFVRMNNFNAIRLPFSVELVLNNPQDTNVDCDKNGQAVCHLDYLHLMDYFTDECAKRGILVMLDQHRIHQFTPENQIEELWYTSKYAEEKILKSWDILLEMFSTKWNVFALDLKNEPHGEASWGFGHVSTDMNKAFERIIQHIITQHPEYKGLFFVEGVENRANTTTPNQWTHFWGGNLEGVHMYPITLTNEHIMKRVIYSPHVYGPDVAMQPYFQVSHFPQNMPEIWDTHFGFVEKIQSEKIGPIVIGEWGGHYGSDSLDRVWQDKIADWMLTNCMNDQFYWCLNPNSGDTGGILLDDWVTPNRDKLNLLHRVQPFPSRLHKNDVTGEYCLEPGQNSCESSSGTTIDDKEFLVITSVVEATWEEAGETGTRISLLMRDTSSTQRVQRIAQQLVTSLPLIQKLHTTFTRLCSSARIEMTPKTLPVHQQWNMQPIGNGIYQLPDWLTIQPGGVYGDVGLVYVGAEENTPQFKLVDNVCQ